MSLLVIGLSHRSAPLPLLERVALDAERSRSLARAALVSEHVGESLVLATCNRVEVYAEVTTFHGGLAHLGQVLSEQTGVELVELTDHLYVHYADRAVTHLFSVACGLDSMAVGEGQVLGQLRGALRVAQDAGDTGRVLDHLMQQALRVGKRAHHETGIDRAGASLVDAGMQRARRDLGPLDAVRVLVVGAGAMSALAASTVRRHGVSSVTVVNRTLERAVRLADAVGGRAATFEDLTVELAAADVVISCTGALGQVIDVVAAARAAAERAAPQLYVDLALPRDVHPDVADLAGVHLVDLEQLGADLAAAAQGSQVEVVRALVEAEVEQYLSAVRVQAVAPTVVALRARAAEVVQAELDRMDQRLPEVDPAVREELHRAVHRVVDKLLHAPTVRVKQLASRQDGSSYAEVLRELFDLDSDLLAAVAEVPVDRALGTLLSAAGQGVT